MSIVMYGVGTICGGPGATLTRDEITANENYAAWDRRFEPYGILDNVLPGTRTPTDPQCNDDIETIIALQLQNTHRPFGPLGHPDGW